MVADMPDQLARAALAIDEVSVWLFSEAMTTLLELLRCEPPSDEVATDATPWVPADAEMPAGLADLLEHEAGYSASPLTGPLRLLERAGAIERQAARQFDFRSRNGQQYRSRQAAAVGDGDLDELARSRVQELTTALGFVQPVTNRYPSYDKTLVLGGGFRSPLLRARYAAHLQDRGVGLGELCFLGSPRSLLTDGPIERLVTDTYAPGATDEFDLLAASSQAEFGLLAAHPTFLCGCDSTESICPRWRHDASNADEVPGPYTHERSLDLHDVNGHRRGSVISASTSRPPHRPDISDSLALWTRLVDPRPGERVLIVTAQPFVPFQRFEGLRRLFLPYGLDMDTVGFGADWADQAASSEYLLQETLSAIRSARRLLVEAIETLRTA